MKFSFVSLAIVTFLSQGGHAFAPRPSFQSSTTSTTRPIQNIGLVSLKVSSGKAAISALFEEEDEMIPIAENFVHAKYQQCVESSGHEFMTLDDCRDVLKQLLPPVTPQELEEEVAKTLAMILKSDKENTEDRIREDCFVNSMVQNSYWKSAGDIVVKELMYFDALYHYYKTGTSLLTNENYEELKENLQWEGSSIAQMNKDECLFVSAVASSRRGEPILEDAEYQALKTKLREQNSWVTNRKADALEKLGLNTFMGYLHRSLK